jgi:hypothetical protein
MLGFPIVSALLWINQNQTFRQEQSGGYLWSLKLNKGGGKNPFYEIMREVSPVDIVFPSSRTFGTAFVNGGPLRG